MTSVFNSLEVLIIAVHCAVYQSWWVYSVSVIPVGFTLTPIVLIAVVGSSRFIWYFWLN